MRHHSIFRPFDFHEVMRLGSTSTKLTFLRYLHCGLTDVCLRHLCRQSYSSNFPRAENLLCNSLLFFQLILNSNLNDFFVLGSNIHVVLLRS